MASWTWENVTDYDFGGLGIVTGGLVYSAECSTTEPAHGDKAADCRDDYPALSRFFAEKATGSLLFPGGTYTITKGLDSGETEARLYPDIGQTMSCGRPPTRFSTSQLDSTSQLLKATIAAQCSR